MPNRNDVWFAEFEALGEEEIRKKVGLGRYSPQHQQAAEEWLRQLDQARSEERERRNDESQSEQIEIARSAKEAAWAAARAAETANKRATIALAIAPPL
jgi:hypothetical protein